MIDSGAEDTSNIRFEATSRGTRFRVRVQPRASRDRLAGEWAGALRVHVAAPPVDGAANDALVRFLAERLGCARSAVRIVSGERGRTKLIEVTDMSPAAVAARLV